MFARRVAFATLLLIGPGCGSSPPDGGAARDTASAVDATEATSIDLTPAPDLSAPDFAAPDLQTPDLQTPDLETPDLAPSCFDGLKNGLETDVDCGGPSCPKCAPGRCCAADADCVAGAICPGKAECCRFPYSCAEIKSRDPQRPSGSARIDPDGPGGPYPAVMAQCEQTVDGGGWTRVFHHQLAGGLLQGFDQALSSSEQDPSARIYSILKYVDAFAERGVYTFRMDWPGHPKRNVWSQLSNPTDDTAVAGYQAIDVQSSVNGWGGLELGNGAHGPPNGNASFLDGSVNHPYWYYAIGVRVPWGSPNGFPASDDVAGAGTGVAEVELWVR